MRVLAVGEDAQIGESIASLMRMSGISLGRVDNSLDALDILDGVESVFVVLPLQDVGDPSMSHIRTLVSKGAVVVVLAATESAPLRAAAFAAGARDVVFQPFERSVTAALLSLLGHPDRREPRFRTELSALIAPPGETDRVATLRNLSRGGFMAEIGTPPIRRGLVVRVALNPPPPHRIPLLFAQSISAEPIENTPGKVAMHARFLGLTTEEQLVIDRLLDTLSGAIEDRPTLLRTLDRLDAAALRDAAQSGAWAGVHLPSLTELEREAISASHAAGSTPRPLIAIAIARCRSSMIASLLENHPELAAAATPRLADWREEMRACRATMHDELSRALASGDPTIVRQLRDLQARVTAAADHLERVASSVTGEAISRSGQALQEGSSIAVYDKAPLPAATSTAASSFISRSTAESPGRGMRVFRSVLGVVALAAVIAAYVNWRTALHAHRNVDVAQTVEAPVAIEQAAGLRVRSTWREGTRANAVIDASWYRLPEQERGAAAAAIAAKIRTREAGATEVLLRDYRGRLLATISATGDVALSSSP